MAARRGEDSQKLVADLHQKIGELTVDLDYLKKLPRLAGYRLRIAAVSNLRAIEKRGGTTASRMLVVLVPRLELSAISKMHITSISEAALSRLPYLNVARDRSLVKEHLPILLGSVSGLPAQLDGLVCMADLQGRERTHDGPGRLLGLPVCEHLLELGIRPADPARREVGGMRSWGDETKILRLGRGAGGRSQKSGLGSQRPWDPSECGLRRAPARGCDGHGARRV